MRLYHGSNKVIEHPDVAFSRSNLDFGRGFYATSHREQAENWARRKAVMSSGVPVVSVFELKNPGPDFKVLRFEEPDAQWVEFVCDCRRGGNGFLRYDLVVGGAADDKVYYAVDMYYRGLWDMETTLKALRFYGINDQWCFVSQNAADELLSFVEAWEVGR